MLDGTREQIDGDQATITEDEDMNWNGENAGEALKDRLEQFNTGDLCDCHDE